MSNISNLSDRKGKILIPIDDSNGYLISEESLRLFASGDRNHISLGDGTPGSHNIFIRYLARDYVKLYRKLEELGEL